MVSDPSDFVLRRAKITEAGAIRDLVRTAYAKYIARMGREPLPMSDDYEQAVRAHPVWVLHEAGGLVAALELIPHPDHLMIKNIVVRPDRQGRGIGKRLLRFAEQEATRQGLGEIRLRTNETMVENLALYAAHGYHEIHRQPHEGTDIVFMSKAIRAPHISLNSLEGC